jgi:putative transposase
MLMPSSMASRSGKLRRSSRPKANRKTKRDCDFALYRERNLIERFFNKIKHFRAIATRYDKLAANFLAAVQLVSAIILLN